MFCDNALTSQFIKAEFLISTGIVGLGEIRDGQVRPFVLELTHTLSRYAVIRFGIGQFVKRNGDVIFRQGVLRKIATRGFNQKCTKTCF